MRKTELRLALLGERALVFAYPRRGGRVRIRITSCYEQLTNLVNFCLARYTRLTRYAATASRR